MNAAWRSLLFTLTAIAGFWAVGRIPNPFLTTEAMSFLYGAPNPPPGFSRASFGPFMLGIGPALSGFFLLELFSFFLPPFSRWRKQGFAGRTRLNRASLTLSFVIALATAYFVVLQLRSGHSSVQLLDGSVGNSIGSLAFFTGGFALVYLGANLLTAFGLGNGFAIFLLAGSLLRLADSFLLQYFPLDGPRPSAWPLVFSLMILGLFYYFLSRRRHVSAEGPGGTSLHFDLPPVLQGLISWSLAWQLAALLRTIGMKYGWSYGQQGGWARYFTFFAFFILTNMFLYWIAFSPKRMLANTFGKLAFPAGSERRILEIAFMSFVVFAGLELLAFIPHPLGHNQTIFSKAFDLGSLVLVFVLGKDMLANFCFLKRVPNFELVGELDNIHLMALARSIAEADGQPVYLKGFEYRRLMSFLQPLVKMRLYASREYAPVLREKLGLDSAAVI